MNPPRTIIGSLTTARGLRRPWLRRLVVLVLIAILMLFTFYPQRYRAAVTITPSDPNSLGVTNQLNQLGALNSVFGNQAAIEMALKVAGSVNVRDRVAARLGLDRTLGVERIEAVRWLDRRVDISALRGGLIQIQMMGRDAPFARQIVGAFADETRSQLARINQSQTRQKRDALLSLVAESSDRLATAQVAYDTFRLSSRFADPGTAVGMISARGPTLDQAIKAKQVELAATRKFYTDDNIKVQRLIAEIDALRTQFAQTQETSPLGSDSVGRAVAASTRALKLQRDMGTAQMIFDRYSRLLTETSAEDLTSSANVRVLEPPFIDTSRQLNYQPLAMAGALLLLLLAIEFYELRPPPGARTASRDPDAER